MHVAGDGAAEDVGEHSREQQWLKSDVEELLRVTPHLLERPPGHRQGLADRLGHAGARARPRDGGRWIDNRPPDAGTWLRPAQGHCAHRTSSKGWSWTASRTWSASLVSCPVSPRNTSSSVGLATLTEVILT